MVVMPVAEYKCIDPAQVRAHHGRIGNQGLPLARIEENGMAGHFDPGGKAMFAHQSCGALIVNQYPDAYLIQTHWLVSFA